MNTRQAVCIAALVSLLLIGLSACYPSQSTPATATLTLPPPSTATITQSPSPIPPTSTFTITPTATPPACLSQPGKIEQGSFSESTPPQEYMIYLPPCYSESVDLRYPVLYLLHGQTYTQDQWIRLGVSQGADRLFQSGESLPFIIVFPDDRYWNLNAGAGFGIRLLSLVIPYVDANYRTLADRDHRSLGGLSRGGGWTVQLGFEHPELFGSLGLHSPAVFKDGAPYIEKLIAAIPEESRPRLWMDAGDNDRELESIMALEETLVKTGYLHQFHLYTGDHSESYWSAHVMDYLRWYAEDWSGELAVP